MHILHICGHKRLILSPAIFRPAIYAALRSRAVSHFESDRIIYTIENIGLIILKQPLKRVVGSIRREWPEVMILLRGDSHFSAPEVHEWCESQEPELFYILGQSGNPVLKAKARGILQ